MQTKNNMLAEFLAFLSIIVILAIALLVVFLSTGCSDPVSVNNASTDRGVYLVADSGIVDDYVGDYARIPVERNGYQSGDLYLRVQGTRSWVENVERTVYWGTYEIAVRDSLRKLEGWEWKTVVLRSEE
jgi:hypothetical protein